jgi:hypothetical protein
MWFIRFEAVNMWFIRFVAVNMWFLRFEAVNMWFLWFEAVNMWFLRFVAGYPSGKRKARRDEVTSRIEDVEQAHGSKKDWLEHLQRLLSERAPKRLVLFEDRK